MKAITGDLWDYYRQTPWTVIVVPVNRLGVMGRGVAKQCRERFPGVENWVKRTLRAGHDLPYERKLGLAFVVVKEHWRDRADLNLIRLAVQKMRESFPRSFRVYLPLLGCGFGELSMEDVVPVLTDLDDHFTLVVPDPEKVCQRYAASLHPGARRDRLLT